MARLVALALAISVACVLFADAKCAAACAPGCVPSHTNAPCHHSSAPTKAPFPNCEHRHGIVSGWLHSTSDTITLTESSAAVLVLEVLPASEPMRGEPVSIAAMHPLQPAPLVTTLRV